jgi:OmpA-OmpF porin, OOP family
MKKIASIIALAFAALTTPLLAHSDDFYIKASIGRSHYLEIGDHADNENPNGASLGLGYIFNKNWDAEFGYTDFGTVKSIGISPQKSLKTQTIYVAGIGKLPITEAFSIFGKAGAAFNYSNLSSEGTSKEYSKTITELLLGAGFSYQFTRELAAIIDYTYYGKGKVANNSAEFKIDQVSFGLKYNF